MERECVSIEIVPALHTFSKPCHPTILQSPATTVLPWTVRITIAAMRCRRSILMPGGTMENVNENHRPNVLVIEDDPSIAEGIVRGLRVAGFDVELEVNGQSGAEKALNHSFDMIVLDLMLPELHGYAVLERWRTRISTPVIVITALTDLDARLRVFGTGAVDYIAKPFWIEELVARIRTRLRISPQVPARTITLNHVVLDLDARSVTVEGRPVSLTNHEFNILAFLAERPGRTISRRLLVQEALSPDAGINERTVDSHVGRIRRKLGDHAGSCIVTVWGIGYRLDPRSGE